MATLDIASGATETFQKQLLPLQNSFDIFDTNYRLLTMQENNQKWCAAPQTAVQRVLWNIQET